MGILPINYVLNRNKPYPALKTGQFSLMREYYKGSTRNKADGKGYTENYKRIRSMYDEKHNDTVTPDNYKDVHKAQNLLSKILDMALLY